MSDRSKLDDFFPDDDGLPEDNFKTSLSESTASLSREELALPPQEEDSARATLEMDSAKRATIQAELTDESPQKHGSRDGFDERLAQVIARKEPPPPVAAPPMMPKKAPPKRKQQGFITASCLTIVLVFGMISGIVAIIALFLPPIADYNPLAEGLWDGDEVGIELTSDERRIEQEGLAIEVLPSDPGENFAVSIQKTAAPENCPALSNGFDLTSSLYRLTTTGTAPQQVGIRLQVPEGATQQDMYGLFGENWHFIPSQLSDDQNSLVTDIAVLPSCLAAGRMTAATPLVSASVGRDATAVEGFDRLFILGMQPTIQGTLQGALPAELSPAALPLITNYRTALDVNTVSTILSNPSLRAAHSENIAAFAASGAYRGVAIEYRGIPAELRHQFSAFVQHLGAQLDSQNQSLIVVVPPAEFTDQGWITGAYDWRTLGWLADEIVLRPPLDPIAFQNGMVAAMLRWGTGEINRQQVSLGLSAWVVESLPDGSSAVVPPQAAWEGVRGVRLEPLGNQVQVSLDSPYQLKMGIDEVSQTPYLQYENEGIPLRTYWLTTDQSLQYQQQFVSEFGLGGVVIFDAQEAAGGDNFNLRWRVLDASGNLLTEQIVPYNTPLLYEGATEGLQFEVALVEPFEVEITSSQAEVNQVAAIVPTVAIVTATPQPTTEVAQVVTATQAVPTATLLPPTATFTPTILPSPTLSPTPLPTINAPEIQGVVPSTFEYGVHIGYEYTDEKFNLMRVAGMTWIKVQIRYQPGLNADDYGWQVQFLHERGFKILWGVVGEKDQVLTAGYFEQYAQFVARLAEIGSDAIEIWNEPNLDREWPTGQVSGASYTELLRTAYLAIKAKNPDTLVISAALAPTGFFGGCQAGGCDDNAYYQQMASAGAAQYMDCIGAHYNEGILSPLATSGDPRDPYPTRYLMPNTDRAYQPFGGQKPVCYTELGYLTSEGYNAPLPTGFEWASDVSVAEQASWLATAALQLAQSGKVRLMIIWNLDYQDFNPDPHGGFAIIRPDGSCPACDSLGMIKAIGGQ